MKRIPLACTLVGALSWVAAAQTPPAPPAFPAEAELVTVDVVVTNGDGVPVRDLKREDFVVHEDGQARSLALFEGVDGAPESPAVSGARPAVSDNLGPPTARPLVVIVFDEPHLVPANVELARMQFRTLPAQKELAGADVLLMSTTGGGSWHVRLPEEASDLAAALARFKGSRPNLTPGRITDYEAFQIAALRNDQVLVQVYRRYLDLRLLADASSATKGGARGAQTDSSAGMPAAGRSAVLVESEERWQGIRRRQAATVAGLTRLIEGLGARRGRKAVMLVTEGFLQEGSVPEYRELSEAARRARAAVHIVDPRDAGRLFHDEADTASSVDSRDRVALMGREMKAAEGADALAAATGGTVLRNLPGLAASLHRIGTELRTYYLLGYDPAGMARDGRFHRISVEVSRPGVRVVARPGYYALDAKAVHAAPPAPLSQVALDAPLDTPDLPLRLAGYVLGPAKKGRTRVRLVAEMDGAAFAASGGSVDAVFQLAAREKPEAQQWATVIKKPAENKSVRVEAEFEAEPGVYQARLMAREQGGSGRTGSVRHVLEVLPLDAFRASTPILTDLASGNVPVPRADRRFRRDAKLFCLIEVMGASASAPVVAGVDLRQADGNVRLRIPPSPMSSAPRSRLWAIPLADLPPGPYELMISVQEGGSNRSLGMREGFEVVSND